MIDDTHQVPDITHPVTAAASNISVSNHPSKPTDQIEGVLRHQDIYSNLLLDMDAVGEEIDRLNEQLDQDLLQVWN